MTSWNQSDMTIKKQHYVFNTIYYLHPIIITIISIILSFAYIRTSNHTRSTIKNEKLETGSISNHFPPRCSPSPPLRAKNPGEIPLQAKLNCQLTVVRHRDQLHACFKARTRCTPRKPSFRLLDFRL